MRFATMSIIGAFVAAVFVMSMWPGDARFGAPSHSIAQQEQDPFGTSGKTEVPQPKPKLTKKYKTDWDQKLRTTLSSVCDFDYDETAFIEVMENLQNDFKINVLLDQSAKDDSLTSDTPVTFSANGLNVGKALKLLLLPCLLYTSPSPRDRG